MQAAALQEQALEKGAEVTALTGAQRVLTDRTGQQASLLRDLQAQLMARDAEMSRLTAHSAGLEEHVQALEVRPPREGRAQVFMMTLLHDTVSCTRGTLQSGSCALQSDNNALRQPG